ncbi:hypothetical protein [Lichenibacterium ramalinae]|uniref:hypothetical protein n=1 Tax=Lichenibacterium ramalinae TaxID=2316527 RepID=UPI001FE13AEA|nr:hypothetical protein [Lichenibacterium ramalinae]
MTERLKALKRILKVQDQLKKTADWRLAEAERAAGDVEAAKLDLADFLVRADLVGPLAGLAVAQARRLDAQGQAAARTVASEAEAMRAVTARQKLVAKSLEALSREEAAAKERKDLERMIEGLAGRAAGPGGD